MAKADISAVDLELERGVLHLAAVNGHADSIATFVQLGASTTARDRAGMTPIDLALQCGNEQVTLALQSAEMERRSSEAQEAPALDAAAARSLSVLSLAEGYDQATVPTP
jgi:ankyrin repeat protein